MAIKSSNITKMDQDVTSIKESLGDTSKLSSMGDGTITGAIKSIEVAATGGKKITQAEYDALESKDGLYYIMDANNQTNEFEQTAASLIQKVDDQTALIGTTDISSMADGTVTKVIVEMDKKLNNLDVGTPITQAEYDALEDKTGVYYILDAKNDAEKLQETVQALVDVTGDTDISSIGDGTITGIIAQSFQSVSDGKTLVANAITDKGVSTAIDAEFATMAANINAIDIDPNLQVKTHTLSASNPTETVTPDNGYDGINKLMITVNAQNKNASLSNSSQVIEPDAGYVLGNVTIPAVTGNAVSNHVLSGKTFNSANNIGATGTMPNRSGQTLSASVASMDDTYASIAVPADGYYDTTSKLKTEASSIKRTIPKVLDAHGSGEWDGSHRYLYVTLDTSNYTRLSIPSSAVSNASSEDGVNPIGLYGENGSSIDLAYHTLPIVNADVSGHNKITIRIHGYDFCPSIDISAITLS